MRICEDCGKEITRVCGERALERVLCQSCYNYFRKGGQVHDLPPFAEVKTDERGFPICHVCGKSYKKILTHAWQRHGLNEKEYKIKFGLDKGKGIIADSTKRKLQRSVNKHYELVVAKNLIKGGEDTRFEVGSIGRVKEKCSPQTTKRLKNKEFKSGVFRGETSVI